MIVVGDVAILHERFGVGQREDGALLFVDCRSFGFEPDVTTKLFFLPIANFQRGGVRMRHSGGVVRNEQVLSFTYASQFNGAFAILWWFCRVGLIQLPGWSRDRSQGGRDHGEGA